VQGVVDIDGVLDLTDPAESGKDTIPGELSAGARWLGATFRADPARWLDASPLHHAGPATPPVCFINSSIPRFHAGRDSMIAILSRFGIRTEVHTLPDTPHPFWLFEPWFGPACRAAVLFLRRTLSPQQR
jgi:pectinesterase